jgi:hypothetical protein
VPDNREGRGPQGEKPAKRNLHGEPPPLSNRMVAIFFAALAAALVLGYFFVNKLADISRQEDCVLARRKNCAAIELPSGRHGVLPPGVRRFA